MSESFRTVKKGNVQTNPSVSIFDLELCHKVDIKADNLLYKYYPYSEYLLEMLITKKAWFSKPETFNDPFDCHLNFDNNIPQEKYEKCLRWQLKREGRSQSQIENDIRNLISQDGIVNNKAKKVIDDIGASTLDVIKNIGVYCLSEVNSNMTMWAYYADNHRGLCLGFLISDDVVPWKVSYVAEAPKVNFSELFNDESTENEYKWIFSKHHDWKNENEWRIVVPQGNQLWPIPGEIKTVTFGLRMDKVKRTVIQQILKNEYNVEYFEAIRNQELLQLNVRKIGADT